MRFGILMPPKIDDYGVVPYAESLGFDSAWLADSQMIWSDCYAVLALAAQQTSRIRLGTGVAIAGTRIAPVTAHSIASINQLAPGRTFLGIGTGHTAMRVMGMDPMPIKAFRDYLRVVRSLLDGDEVEYTLNGVTKVISLLHQDMGFFNLADRVPIYIAANGPLALRTAGEFADGLMSIFNEQAPVLAQNQQLVAEGAAKAGRKLPSDYLMATVTSAIPLSAGEAVNSARVIDEAGPWAACALHFVYEVYQKTGDEAAVPPAFHGVFEAYCAHVAAMKTPADKRYLEIHNGHGTFIVPQERHFMTPEVLHGCCLIGEPDELVEKLRVAERNGLNEVTIVPPTAGARKVIADFEREVMRRY